MIASATGGGEQVDRAASCHPYGLDFPISSKSFHVLDYNTDFKLQVRLLQLIIPDEGVECAILDQSTQVRILNGVGLSEANVSVLEYAYLSCTLSLLFCSDTHNQKLFSPLKKQS